jgi:hypothetical protein
MWCHAPGDELPVPSPWGFRLTIFLVVLYLLYRLGQGVVWLYDWLINR